MVLFIALIVIIHVLTYSRSLSFYRSSFALSLLITRSPLLFVPHNISLARSFLYFSPHRSLVLFASLSLVIVLPIVHNNSLFYFSSSLVYSLFFALTILVIDPLANYSSYRSIARFSLLLILIALVRYRLSLVLFTS